MGESEPVDERERVEEGLLSDLTVCECEAFRRARPSSNSPGLVPGRT